MKREDLVDFTDEQKDLVMQLYGKAISKKDKEIEKKDSEINNLNEKVNTYETKINEFNENAKDNEEWKTKYDELNSTIQQQEAERKAKQEDDALTQRIINSFGDKQFINELTKEALIGKMKGAIKDEVNVGKSDSEIFNSLTKDQENIFVNPNKPADIPPMGEITSETKEIPTIW